MAFFKRIANLFSRSKVEQEIDAELTSHLEMRIEDNIAAGMSPADARRDAVLRFGNPAAMKEQVAGADATLGLACTGADVRFALRQLRRSPGFTITSILILGIAIGACTAIFGSLKPILLDPLPYPQASRIMMIWSTYHGARSKVAFGSYRELVDRSRSFDAMAVFEPWPPTMTGGSQPERLEGQSVSASFFSVIGVVPLLGRDFQASEEIFHGPKVVILSDKLWQRHFGGDRAIIGSQVKLDGDNYTVVGVMPPAFENVLSPSAEIWTPMQYDIAQISTNFQTGEWGNRLRMAGRLKPGVGRDQATQELDQIARAPWAEFPRPRWASLQHGLIVDSLQDDITRGVRPALLAVLGAVILVLTIACVNVVNLLLARSAQRQGEFAVRAALGASRLRIIRQLVTESLLLALLGGALGMGIAGAGVRALIALSPAELPRHDAIAVNMIVFTFALGITTLIGLVTGLIPALHVSREEMHPGFQQSSRRTANSHSRTRSTLVVTEVALAMILLISAGLLLRSMQRLLTVDPGFNTSSHLLTMQVQTSGHQFDDLRSAPGVGDGVRRRFFEQALEAVRRVPGVKQAAFTSFLPLSDDSVVVGSYGAQFENDDPQSGHDVFRYAVSPDYCQVMGISLRSGRCLDESDTATAPQAALISESLAKSQFPGQSPIGKRLHVGPTDRPWYTVVGVVGDVKQTSLATNQPDAVYLSTEQTWFADDTLSFVIRTQGDAAALAPAVKSAVWSVDKDQPIVRVATMENLVATSAAERRFVLILFELFGVTALVLATTGIYGILSGSVTERRREIGVRAALGASRRDILALIMGQGMALVTLGVVIGLVAAIAASGAILTLLFGVSKLDPITYLAVIALLLAISGVACFVPARRAASVNPVDALRAE